MSIVTISRGSYSHGKEVAEKLAQRLGYECLSREVILRASEHFNVPEIKLARAIHDAPSIFDRLTYGKERYIAYIREALLHHLSRITWFITDWPVISSFRAFPMSSRSGF